MAKRLRAKVGLAYPPEDFYDAALKGKPAPMIRREAGEFCDDLPERVRESWLAAGAIEEVDAPKPRKKKAKQRPRREESSR